MTHSATIYYGGFLSRAGGAFNHARMFAEQLGRDGWKVDVITLDRLPLWCRFLPHIAERALALLSRPMALLIKGRLTRLLYKSLLAPNSDFYLFEDIYISWPSDIPSVTIIHAVWSDNLQAYRVSKAGQRYLRRHEARLINAIEHALVTVSVPYRAYLKNVHFSGIKTRDFGVVELGVCLPSLTVRHEKRDIQKRSMITVGSLEARKNIPFMIDVLENLQLSGGNFTLTIVGDGSLRQHLQALTLEKGVTVIFCGRLPPNEVLAALANSEIYIHTSVKESFSFALLEAKLCGLFTIASAGLEVPSEFIDSPQHNFDASSWAESILAWDGAIELFDPSIYRSDVMVTRTLALAGIYQTH